MTQVYDMIILVGTIALVFVIIAWGVSFGAQIASDSLLSTPILVQTTMASYASTLCTFSGNAVVDYMLNKQYPMEVIFNSTHVWAKATDSRYYPFKDVQRGGYLGFGIQNPSVWVGCMPVEEKKSTIHVGIEDTVSVFKDGDRLSTAVK